jgi:hypothetical protein
MALFIWRRDRHHDDPTFQSVQSRKDVFIDTFAWPRISFAEQLSTTALPIEVLWRRLVRSLDAISALHVSNRRWPFAVEGLHRAGSLGCMAILQLEKA